MKLEKKDILNILPQREPLLLIDRAELISYSSVQAEVFLNPDWEIFHGHFPEHPVLPGIYITESMAQAADLILLSLPGNEKKLPLFLGISQMRFLRPAYPGDTMQLFARIECDPGNGMYDCSVSASINNKKIAIGKISLALK